MLQLVLTPEWELQYKMFEIFRVWGTTADERECDYPCDALLGEVDESYFRGVTVQATPAIIFRWICQLKAAPYSYDWIDNYGRKSPRELTPGMEKLEIGQRFMSIFELTEFEQDAHVTLLLRKPGLFPPLAVSYTIVPNGQNDCRLIVKLALRRRAGLRDRLLFIVFGPLDWFMMRRQLLNLKALAEETIQEGKQTSE